MFTCYLLVNDMIRRILNALGLRNILWIIKESCYLKGKILDKRTVAYQCTAYVETHSVVHEKIYAMASSGILSLFQIFPGSKISMMVLCSLLRIVLCISMMIFFPH